MKTESKRFEAFVPLTLTLSLQGRGDKAKKLT
jgi:hypothetical protein